MTRIKQNPQEGDEVYELLQRLSIVERTLNKKPDADAIESVEIGALQAFAITPSNKWALADGSAVTVSSGRTVLRDALIAAGGPYGFSGSDPKLPDLRGRAVIGAGTGSGLTTRLPGTQVGTETHLITAPQSGLPSHAHGISARQGPTGTHGHAGSGVASVPSNQDSNGSAATDSVGGFGWNAIEAHPNMQPSLVVPVYVRVAL